MAILTSRPELLTTEVDDVLHIVDVSDPTDDPTGSSKKIKVSNLIPSDHGNVNAASDLPNNLIVVGEEGTDVKTAGITVDEIATPPDKLPLSLNVSAARNWDHITVNPGDNWRDTIATRENFLIASNTGIIKISSDGGQTWVDPSAPIAVADTLQGMAYDEKNNITMACSFQGNLFRSLDEGDTWATVNLGAIPTPAFQDIRFANGVFIAVGDTILYSEDGSDLSWTVATFPPFAADVLHDLAFGNGRWIGVGGGADTFAYASDDNGRTWSQLTEPFTGGTYHSIIFVKNSYYPNGSFFATKSNGELLRTATGETWVIINDFGTSGFIVFYAGGQWLVGGAASTIITSWDSVTWITFTPAPTTQLISSFSYQKNVFIATGSTAGGDIFRSAVPPATVQDTYINDGESASSVIPNSVAFMDARDTTSVMNNITINTAGVPVVITGRTLLINSLSQFFTLTDVGGIITITCIKPGIHTYLAYLRCVLDPPGTNAISMGLFLNGSPLQASFVDTLTNISPHLYASFSHLQLTEGDVLTLAVRNATNAGNMDIGAIQIAISWVK